MYYDQATNLTNLVLQAGCSIFATAAPLPLRPTFTISPAKGKSTISVEQIRDEVLARTMTKTKTPQIFLITPADAMTVAAQNAFLKTLEEPKENYHFVLATATPSTLLPTILSRAKLYQNRPETPLDPPLNAPQKALEAARSLIKAKPAEMPALSKKLADGAKKAENQHVYALEIVDAAIEILYKSYYKTENPAFLAKLPQFLRLREALAKNGHIRLQILANLI